MGSDLSSYPSPTTSSVRCSAENPKMTSDPSVRSFSSISSVSDTTISGLSSSSSSTMSEIKATKEHCALCFIALETLLRTGESLLTIKGSRRRKLVPLDIPFGDTAAKPLFVTWNLIPSSSIKKSSGNVSSLIQRLKKGSEKLRGCQGCLNVSRLSSDYTLTNMLINYAIRSGTKDRRFSPIKLSELSLLQCTVSILYNFIIMRNWMQEWDVDRHGITLNISVNRSWLSEMERKGRYGISSSSSSTFLSSEEEEWVPYRATYLPGVVSRVGWDRKQTLTQLIKKSGLPRSEMVVTPDILSSLLMSFSDLDDRDADKPPSSSSSMYDYGHVRFEFVRYESTKFSLTYDEYVRMMEDGSILT